jgi:hypothetical protein
MVIYKNTVLLMVVVVSGKRKFIAWLQVLLLMLLHIEVICIKGSNTNMKFCIRGW